MLQLFLHYFSFFFFAWISLSLYFSNSLPSFFLSLFLSISLSTSTVFLSFFSTFPYFVFILSVFFWGGVVFLPNTALPLSHKITYPLALKYHFYDRRGNIHRLMTQLQCHLSKVFFFNNFSVVTTNIIFSEFSHIYYVRYSEDIFILNLALIIACLCLMFQQILKVIVLLHHYIRKHYYIFVLIIQANILKYIIQLFYMIN